MKIFTRITPNATNAYIPNYSITLLFYRVCKNRKCRFLIQISLKLLSSPSSSIPHTDCSTFTLLTCILCISKYLKWVIGACFFYHSLPSFQAIYYIPQTQFAIPVFPGHLSHSHIIRVGFLFLLSFILSTHSNKIEI